MNTNFDAKEKMSRNYVNAIGPNDEPVLIYFISSGSPVSNISVVWVNPVKNIEDVGEIALDENLGVIRKRKKIKYVLIQNVKNHAIILQIHHCKSNLKTPLLPGIWEVYLIHMIDVLARVTFLVNPLETMSGKPIKADQAKFAFKLFKLIFYFLILRFIIQTVLSDLFISVPNCRLFLQRTGAT